MENKTIIYLRTSTEEQNPENQLKDCLSINSYGEYEVIEDKQSAWKDNKERLGFEKSKQLIQMNKVAHFICWDLDRIYRNRKKLTEFFELCKLYNCKIHSFRQDWLEQLHKIPEPFNEIMYNLMINLMGWLAEEESNKKSERTKNAVRKEGEITISYKGNKWGRKELPEQTKKAIIELYNQGKPYSQICSEVFYYDRNRNEKNVSKGFVHKIISQYKQENKSL